MSSAENVPLSICRWCKAGQDIMVGRRGGGQETERRLKDGTPPGSEKAHLQRAQRLVCCNGVWCCGEILVHVNPLHRAKAADKVDVSDAVHAEKGKAAQHPSFAAPPPTALLGEEHLTCGVLFVGKHGGAVNRGDSSRHKQNACCGGGCSH